MLRALRFAQQNFMVKLSVAKHTTLSYCTRPLRTERRMG